MEEIIGLLVALAVIIFKVVGKKLEKSGEIAPENAEDSRTESAESPFDVTKWIEEAMREVQIPVEPAAVEELPQQLKFVEEAPSAVVKPAPVQKKVIANPLMTGAPEKTRENIDPKKLIVYSEIMKPKFKEEN